MKHSKETGDMKSKAKSTRLEQACEEIKRLIDCKIMSDSSVPKEDTASALRDITQHAATCIESLSLDDEQ